MNDYDIELCLTDISVESIKDLSKVLPSGYSIEDRTENGWGLVIRSNNEDEASILNDKVRNFLSGISPIKEWIKSSQSILRVAHFSESFTNTIVLEEFESLVSFKLKLEISIYPSK